MKNHLSSPNGATDHSPGLSGHKTAQPWGYYKIVHPSPVRAAENCVLSKLHAYLWTGFYSVALSGLLGFYSYYPGIRILAGCYPWAGILRPFRAYLFIFRLHRTVILRHFKAFRQSRVPNLKAAPTGRQTTAQG